MVIAKKSGNKSKGKPFSVDTMPTKQMVVSSLTRDITVEASIFDLIDNAIDAARDTIFAKADESPGDGLPSSYRGFKITLNFSSDGFSIVDNCGGIDVARLQKMVLKFGQQSSHPMGIGIFGLGLNRALFKLGHVSHIRTDTGSQRSELVLNVDEYLKSSGWDLPAEEFKSSGEVGTTIEITHLVEDISKIFSDSDWVEKYRADIDRRYARFIRKGLTIKVNSKAVQDGEVHIRSDGPFPEEYKFYKIDGVAIHLRFGQHTDHRFTAEPDYDKDTNRPLTQQFGWTVICNDRAIVVSDQTWKTGWDTKFHTEFYGFVGVVSFESESPSRLPWDTTKFDIDMNNRAYQAALVDMRKFAEKWRSYTKRAKNAQRDGETLLPLPGGKSTSNSNPGAAKKSAAQRKSSEKATKKIPTRKVDHNQFSTVLPEDIDEQLCFDKHLALVHEAKNLDLNLFTYSGLALIRCLFEATVSTYLGRHGRLDELKEFAISERKKNRERIPDEKNLSPNMEEIIGFLENNPDIWGAVKQNHIRHSLRRMSAQKKQMNSALHNPWQPINKAEAFAIRDEILPVLRHLIET